jgi:hypothetical protein
MKKFLIRIFVGLLFIGLLAPGANAQVSDTLKIGQAVGDTGQTVTVAVGLVNPVHVIQGFELELTYNRTYLHAIYATIRATGRAHLFDLSNSINLDTVRVTGAFILQIRIPQLVQALAILF